MKKYDYLIVGAGLFGATFANLAYNQGKRCLVIDKRPHLGGNIYCEKSYGITVHKYGPHIFHTSKTDVWDFVNSFVPFNRFTLCTMAYNHGKLYNLPFNMNTFYQMWGVTRPEEAMSIIESQRLNIEEPQNLEEQALKLVGRDVYDTLIKEYTEKQWGKSCTELPASIIRRLPVRFTFNNNYFNDKYQGIPEGGYNVLIDALLHGIECHTGCDYLEHRYELNQLADKVIYSGPIDAFYDYRFGHLEYRSLRFEHERLDCSNWQGNAIINYPTHKVPYTRIVEHKHFDINNPIALNSPNTIITREYPVAYDSTDLQEPYYPINDEKNQKLYECYHEMAKLESNVLFGGRLAEYKYYDMDDTIESAMRIFKEENK